MSFQGSTKGAKLAETCLRAGSRYVLVGIVESEGIGGEGGRAAVFVRSKGEVNESRIIRTRRWYECEDHPVSWSEALFR